MPTASSTSIARSSALPLETSTCARTASAIWLPDAVHRVQAGERILEDHRDVLAAHVAQLGRRGLQQVLPVQQDLARDLRALRVEQAEDGEVGDALARAGLAHDAERLAAPQREREAGDGVHDAVLRRELDREVAHFEEELAAHP